MKKVIPRSVSLGFLCGLAIIIITAALPYHNVQLLQNSERWVNHTMEVLRAADALRIAVTDAESGQRGFLLTQNPTYLEPYNVAKRNISQHLSSLASLTADNPSQQIQLNNLTAHITEKFDELEATVELQNASRRSDALDLVTTNRGNNLMQHIRNGLMDFETAERKLLNERVAETRLHFQRTFYSFLLITLLTFLLFTGLYFFIVRSFREKRVAEIALMQQSNLLTSVVNSMSEGVSVFDTNGKTIIYNPVLVDIYGQDVATCDLQDSKFLDKLSVVNGSVLTLDNFPAAKVLQGAPQASIELIVQPDDVVPPKVVRVSARPIINDMGSLEGVVCISIDISDDKKSELRLRLATEQADAANKAKSEFVANMSHEIRTPLNAILGMAQLLSKTELVKAQKKYVDMVILSGKSLLNILNDILDFSKIEAGKMQLAPIQFRLNDVMQALGTIMSMAALKKDIELIIDIASAIPPLLIGDSHRLHQILVNLVSNAIKFTEHGEVALIVSVDSMDVDKINLRFAVKDTGMGMTQAQQDRLFSAFAQADTSVTRQFGGTGLGLIISRKLAALMGGHIHVTSHPGYGSEFSLVLPFTRCNEIERRAFPRHSLNARNLLVIDSNETSRNALANHISMWRWTADVAASLDAGLEFLRASHASNNKYDAILLDWQITGEHGEKSLNAIRTALIHKTPIVLMVNMYVRENIAENAVVGDSYIPISFLVKPIVPSSLFDALHEVLAPEEKKPKLNGENGSPYQPLQNIHLLVVEDNKFNQIVARDLLQHVGAIVDVVENGQLAIDVLRTNINKYDAILMDVQMPIMDGFTATRIIRQELRITTPIIATTAGVTAFERESCLASGMNDLIAKPIEEDKMVATIRLHTSGKMISPEHTKIEIINSTQQGDGIFDITNLLKIGEKTPDYPQKLVLIIKNLINNANDSFESAKANFASQNYEAVASTFHTLRGSLGVIGAKKLAENTLVFEKLVSEKAELNDLQNSFDAVEMELAKTIACANDWAAKM